MWTVSKTEVADLLKLDLLARLREAREKASLFERTHQQPFEAFEQAVLHEEENFAQWDAYVEWKAYRKGDTCKFCVRENQAAILSG